MTKHCLFVCTTCASVWQEGKKVGISGGEKLLDRLSHLHQDWELREDISIEPATCMSACSRSCAIALASAGKYTYLFGDLTADEDSLPDTCAAVLNCAGQYFTKPDGLLAWSERPELMKKGAIARIPPLPDLSSQS
jgi:predicted metal-binding protein